MFSVCIGKDFRTRRRRNGCRRSAFYNRLLRGYVVQRDGKMRSLRPVGRMVMMFMMMMMMVRTSADVHPLLRFPSWRYEALLYVYVSWRITPPTLLGSLVRAPLTCFGFFVRLRHLTYTSDAVWLFCTSTPANVYPPRRFLAFFLYVYVTWRTCLVRPRHLTYNPYTPPSDPHITPGKKALSATSRPPKK